MKESTKKNIASILAVLIAAEGGIESLPKVVEVTGLTTNQVNGSQGVWSHSEAKEGVEPPKALWTVEKKEGHTFLRVTDEGRVWVAPTKAAPVAKAKVVMTEEEAKRAILEG